MSMTAQQLGGALLAVLAFVPATVCTGYLVAWFSNLHDFRQRSLVERAFWSIPLSFAVSPIAAVLIGKALSLTAASLCFVLCAVASVVVIAQEHRENRRTGRRWNIGFRPHGATALTLAMLWVFIAALSLVDIQVGNRLWMNVAILDQCFRVEWIEAVLRTGIPPANPQYFFEHTADMHNYYFWYVLCAAVARMAHLSARAVMVASSVWSGFLLASVTGLYLKYFLEVQSRLRRQFLRAAALFLVTGLDLCFICWEIFIAHEVPAPDFEAWSKDGVISWLHTLLWAPHHLAGLMCCMFALLIAWLAGRGGERRMALSVSLIAAALASAFGISIYVTFAFFLVMLAWAVWQFAVERSPWPPLLMAAGGAGALVLLIPYFLELTHTTSAMHGGGPFALTVREMIPPDGLLALPVFARLAAIHPAEARTVAKLLLLIPGYAIELGFYLFVLLIYLVSRWRGRVKLGPAQRTLVFIALAALPAMSFLRSSVLSVNDFGWRSALLLQYPLLLLATEVLTGWRFAEEKRDAELAGTAVPRNTPRWIRSVAALALVVGFFGTICQALSLRFAVPLAEAATGPSGDWRFHAIPHGAYISAIGYSKLNAIIPQNAVVQFNPYQANSYWTMMDMLNVNRQIAITGDQPWCGSELGGDPSGCVPMASALDVLFRGAPAAQARATCSRFGIQYLVATAYDPAWKQADSWVWTLHPVVADAEFRALDCR